MAATSRASQEALSLVSLPSEVIERLAEHLSVKERVALCSANKALAQLAGTSARLWANMDLVVQSGRQVAPLWRWLHCRRQQLGRLSIAAAGIGGFDSQLMQLPGRLAGSPLNTLHVRVEPGTVEVGGWLAGVFPGLRSLEVCADEILVEPDLAQLTTLTRLGLDSNFWEAIGDPILLPQRCLPPRLASLMAVQLGVSPISGAGRLPPLEDLAVSFHEGKGYQAAQDFGQYVSALTLLTSLRISSGPAILLPGLSALTSLRRLFLSLTLSEEESETPHILSPLLALRRLTRLELCNSDLQTVPAGILDLPELRELDLSYNPLRALPGAKGAPLESLSLSLEPAARVADQLVGLTSLRTLCLVEGHTEGPVEGVAQLLQAIGRLPSLQLLDVQEAISYTSFYSGVAVAALWELAQHRTNLRIKTCL